MSHPNLRPCLLGALLSLLLAAPPAFAQRDGCSDHRATASTIVVAPQNEPGDRLRIEGVVLGRDGKPRAGVDVRVFQTDAAGWYSPGGMDEAKARICGVFKTASDGSYSVDTVVPGAYATGNGPAPHVHFDVREPPAFFTLTWQAAAENTSAEDGNRSNSVRPMVRVAQGHYLLVYDLVVGK